MRVARVRRLTNRVLDHAFWAADGALVGRTPSCEPAEAAPAEAGEIAPAEAEEIAPAEAEEIAPAEAEDESGEESGGETTE